MPTSNTTMTAHSSLRASMWRSIRRAPRPRCLRAIREARPRASTGAMLPCAPRSICVHSDTPNAVEVARAVRDALMSLRNH